MTQEQKPNRYKLTVTTIDPQKPVGDKGAVKLPFKAKDQDGKELAYFTFSKALFDFIKPEAVIDTDIEITTRETETATYTDRKLVQIYRDGQPVSQKKQWQGSGHNSPEQRKSIEGQVCLKELGEMIRWTQMVSPQRIELFWKIIELKLFDWTGIEIKPQPAVKPPVVPSTTKEVKTPPVPTSAKVEASKTLPTPDKITKVTGDAIVAWAKDEEMKTLIRGYMAKEFKRVKVGDMTEPEGQQLLEALKEGKIKKEEKS